MIDLHQFINKVKSVVEKSYQFEFADVDMATGEGLDPGMFGDIKSQVVLERASLFIELKDAYELMDKKEKKLIDHLVISFSKLNVDKILSNMNDFIDYKIGGRDGMGACLQDATATFSRFHEYAIKTLELQDECSPINNNIDDYRVMPKPTTNKNESAPKENTDESIDEDNIFGIKKSKNWEIKLII